MEPVRYGQSTIICYRLSYVDKLSEKLKFDSMIFILFLTVVRQNGVIVHGYSILLLGFRICYWYYSTPIRRHNRNNSFYLLREINFSQFSDYIDWSCVKSYGKAKYVVEDLNFSQNVRILLVTKSQVIMPPRESQRHDSKCHILFQFECQ